MFHFERIDGNPEVLNFVSVHIFRNSGACAELSTHEFQPFYGAPFRGSKKDSFYQEWFIIFESGDMYAFSKIVDAFRVQPLSI